MRVFITRNIPEEGLRILRGRFDVDVFPHERPITVEELLGGVREADALLCLLTDRITPDVLDAAPRLKVIANYAVGYDNIDVRAAAARGITVTNTPGVLTEATADLAFALLIACARRIVEADRWLRANAFPGWSPMLFRGVDLVGMTLGIVGAGRIGSALARRCAGGFGMHVLYTDRQENAELERSLGARRVELDALLAGSDFVSLHVPLDEGTRHLIGRRELALMKPTAVLVNTARGPVVDEQALIESLHERKIFAAGLDVFEHEPEVPDALRNLENAVILPHIGSASFETRARMAVIAAENIAAVLEGRPALNPVTP